MKERLLRSVDSVRLPVNLIVYMRTPRSHVSVPPTFPLLDPSWVSTLFSQVECWRAVALNLFALGDRFEYRGMSGSFLKGPNSRCLRGQSEL